MPRGLIETVLFARAAPGASAPYQIPALAVGRRNKADLGCLFFGLVRAGKASQGSAGASFKEGTAGVVGFAIVVIMVIIASLASAGRYSRGEREALADTIASTSSVPAIKRGKHGC